MNTITFPLLLVVMVPLIAFLYASVGFGGASGYLAVMSLFPLSPKLMASTALLLNLFVSFMAFLSYFRSGHFQPRLLWPFLLTSIPATFLGGAWEISNEVYFILLYLTLTYVAIRMLFSKDHGRENQSSKIPSSLWVALLSGAGIGLLSGIIGIGGGIFLSPLIVLANWGTPKQAASSAAGFIFINSISGLLGRLWGGNMEIGVLGWSLIPLGVIGGWVGSRLGARRFSNQTVRRLLGIVLAIAAARYWISLLL